MMFWLCCKEKCACPGWVAQLVGTSSCTPKGCRFDFLSGHILGCRLDPWSGHMWEAANWCFSHQGFFLSVPLSVKSMNMSLGEGEKKIRMSLSKISTWILPSTPLNLYFWNLYVKNQENMLDQRFISKVLINTRLKSNLC